MRTVRIGTHDTVVDRRTLDMLREKERAHDAYMHATRVMGRIQRVHFGREDRFSEGYLCALRDFARAVMDAP